MDLTGAAATEDPVFHHCNFLRNTGYGLKINNATVVGATIESECEFAFNGSGDYINNGTDTIFQEATSNTATATAVWAKAVEGLTAEQMLRVMLSALAGKRSGIGTATETYYGQDAVTPRITLTPDQNGNGLPTVNGNP